MTANHFMTGSVEEHNLNDQKIKEFKKRIEKEKILSCLILKNNHLVFEYYKNNKVPNTLQTINSCTKSIISALIGLLIDNGILESVHTPISEYFGDIINEQSDERLRAITIHHLMTMTPGFDWPEFGEWNCFAPMVYSSNIIKFILSRPIISEPGQAMNYNSGCSHLLSAIIQKLTNMKTQDFAKKYIFDEIGIEGFMWHSKQGVDLGADGLRITSYDMLRFGSLYLNEGSYNRKQLISREWIKASTAPLYRTYDSIGYYGYHWWASSVIDSRNKKIDFYFALGFGGQYIIIVPELDMVVVFTSRMYNASLRPMHYFKEYILEANIV